MQNHFPKTTPKHHQRSPTHLPAHEEIFCAPKTIDELDLAILISPWRVGLRQAWTLRIRFWRDPANESGTLEFLRGAPSAAGDMSSAMEAFRLVRTALGSR